MDDSYNKGNFFKDLKHKYNSIMNRTWKDFSKSGKPSIKGGTYKCSCNYIYIIKGNGVPDSKFKCEWCGEECGGENNNIIERAGHENLSDEEAMTFID